MSAARKLDPYENAENFDFGPEPEQKEEKVTTETVSLDKEDRVTYHSAKPQSHLSGMVKGLVSFLFVAVVLGYSFWQTSSLAAERDALLETKAELEEQLEEEKAESLLLRINQSYYDSDEYKEDMARNRFRLIYPNEMLITVSYTN